MSRTLDPQSIAGRLRRRRDVSADVRSHLTDWSAAYGTVADALESMPQAVRESGPILDRAFRELVNAIHAPRGEAARIAAALVALVREDGCEVGEDGAS